MTNEMRIEIEQKRMKTTHNLVALATENHGLANFSYAKELYINLKNGAFNYLPQDQQKETFQRCLNAFEIAASKGVHSSNLYLGMIYLEGVYVEKDVEKGIDFYVRGAAKNNAFCFFELSRIYSGQDGMDRDRYLEFSYLKRAAEEGFVRAQHMLGCAYH